VLPEATALPEGDVLRIARLARLELTKEAAAEHGRRLGAVLGYMRTLSGVNVEGVEPMGSPLEVVRAGEGAPPPPNALREDEPGPTLPTDVLMRMAPEGAARTPYVRVPKVIKGGSGA